MRRIREYVVRQVQNKEGLRAIFMCHDNIVFRDKFVIMVLKPFVIQKRGIATAFLLVLRQKIIYHGFEIKLVPLEPQLFTTSYYTSGWLFGIIIYVQKNGIKKTKTKALIQPQNMADRKNKEASSYVAMTWIFRLKNIWPITIWTTTFLENHCQFVVSMFQAHIYKNNMHENKSESKIGKTMFFGLSRKPPKVDSSMCLPTLL